MLMTNVWATVGKLLSGYERPWSECEGNVIIIVTPMR